MGKEPCAPLYVPERRNQLIYRVSYFGARINLEMFHAMTDGNGGFLFLKSLVRNYLMLRHPGTLDSVPTPNSASEADLEQDSFKNFYEGTRRASQTRPPKAYHLRGARLPYDQLQYFEGHLHVKEVLDRARTLGVSLSSYLGASLMLAIYSEMPAMERRKPISISLPVNLRNYYPSETARNFFNSVYVTHTLTDDDTLETVAPVFDAKLKEILHPENIKAQMDEYEKLEDQVDDIRERSARMFDEQSRAMSTEQQKKFYKELQSLVVKAVVLLTAAVVYALIPKVVVWGKVSAACVAAVAAGVLASGVMTFVGYKNYGGGDFDFVSWLQSVVEDSYAEWAIAASVIATASAAGRSPLMTALILVALAAYQVFDEAQDMYKIVMKK